jgi:hypothetical protein
LDKAEEEEEKVSKESYFRGKRELLPWQKRPTNTGIPEVLELDGAQIVRCKSIFPPYGS